MIPGLKDKHLWCFVFFFLKREEVNLTNVVVGLRVIWEQSVW